MNAHQSQLDKKKVLKNTFVLYARMLLIMLVQFYTIRVTLQVLGVEDYGISNLVGGVANLFTFITHSMISASQRFIAFDLGKGDISKLRKTIDTILFTFFVFAIIIVLSMEVIGNLAILHFLVIPGNRVFAALVVFQITLASLFFSMITMPFSSLIVAHEDMNIYAYTSVLEVLLKLIVIFLLVITPVDKLILYTFLYFCIQFIMATISIAYSYRNYEEFDKQISVDKKIIKEIVPFMTWNLFGGLSWMLCTQGMTVVINLFFGPIANASKAIADKIQSVVNGFAGNFMTAAQPQIVKTYANGELSSMHNLLFLTTKISFYLLLILAFPVIFNAKPILTIWLGQTDMVTVRMTQLILLFSIIGAYENPINYAIRATGNIKKYQIYMASITLLVIPTTCLFFYLECDAYYGFVALILIEIVALLIRLFFLKVQIGITFIQYFENVIIRQVLCLFAVTIGGYGVMYLGGVTIMRVICTSLMIVMISLITIYTIGLTSLERAKFKLFIKNKYISK